MIHSPSITIHPSILYRYGIITDIIEFSEEIYDEQTITVGLFRTQHVQMKLSIVISLDYLISAFLYLMKKENNNNNNIIILYLDYIISI